MDKSIRNLRIGDILKENGYVTDEQIDEAVLYQQTHEGMRIGGALTALGYISEGQLLQALGLRLGMPVIEIGEMNIQLSAVGKIPRPLAEKYEILAIGEKNGILRVALNDPLNFYAIEDIRQVTGLQLSICLTGREPLLAAIRYYYAEVDARRAAAAANSSFGTQEVETLEIDENSDDDTPVINLLNRLISRAFSTNSSDIHIEPFENRTNVRMRLDGDIVDYVTLKKSVHAPLIARIKILGGMDIAEKRIPQDGHFRTKIEGEMLNIRVSVIPTVFGEKAVLRLLANRTPIDRSDLFGMDEADYRKVCRMLEAPHGMIYFTGPTGSGKTTTLYMILERLSGRPVNISTIEDPVEKNLDRVNQMQVNTQAGLTFESGLRALLRQDPDVIMVGETRDTETAAIAARAAITGHLVFSTLHTNDAASSITRLEDMGLEPYMAAASLVGVVAQRLVRKVCPDCAEETEANEQERALFGGRAVKLRHGRGCANCHFTGYRGRIAVHEVLVIDSGIRRMILNHSPAEEIIAYAKKTQNMRTLTEACSILAEQGVTTAEELRRVSYQGQGF